MKTKKKTKRQVVHNRLPEVKEEAGLPIVSRIAFRAIRMVQADSLVDVPPDRIPSQTSISVNTGFGRNAADAKSLVGVVSFAMASHNEGDETALIRIRCKMQLLYELLSGTVPTPEEVKAQEYAITAMVSYQAWPYIREHVHSMTLKMGLPPLVLQPLVINPVKGSPGTFQWRSLLSRLGRTTNKRPRKRPSKPKVTDRRMREILTAILTGKPIPPPDAKGWDAASLLVTASILVTRAVTLIGKPEANSRARRTRKKSPRRSRQS